MKIKIPEVSDAEIAFPCNYKTLLPKWSDLSESEKNMSGPFCKAATMLFYKGGRIEDHGLKIKSDLDSSKVYRYLKATLGDYGPKHEHKIGGIGHMLSKWCDIIK